MFEKLLLAAIVTFSLYLQFVMNWSSQSATQFRSQAPHAQTVKLLLSQNFDR